MNKWTLQKQITLFIGLITVLACILLTTDSILTADKYYKWLDYLEQIVGQYVLPNQFILPDYISFTMFAKRSIGFMILVVILALCGTYWAMGRLTRPLSILAESIRRVDEQHLYQRVHIRNATSEIAQLTKDFNNMMESLETSFATQKRFAANTAHELKTPLTAMKTSLQVLEMEDEPSVEEYQEFMQDTKGSLERLIKTVENLMDLVNHTIEEDYDRVLVNSLVEQAAKDLSIQASEKKIGITVMGGKTEAILNQTFLYRVIYNLIDNSIKYGRDCGSVEIRISKIRGKYIEIEIKDDGIGMLPEDLAHIFEPFYRADHSRSQLISGSGLGMSIVKQLLDKMEGDIRVESEKGKGSRITIVFPAKPKKQIGKINHYKKS